MQLGSFSLLELLLSQEFPARNSRRLLYLLGFTSWDPNRCVVVELFSIKSVIVTRSSCAEKLQIVLSPRSYFLRTNWREVSAPIRTVLSQEAAAGSSRSFFCVSLLILFETPNRGGFGQLSPIRAVFVTRISERSICRFLCLLFNFPWDPQPVLIWAAIPY